MRKALAGIALAISTIVPTALAAEPAEAATRKWPTHARVITNERQFENSHRGPFRITTRAQDGHGRHVDAWVSLYVNGKHQRTRGTDWGWRGFLISRADLPDNRTARVTVVIKPRESRKRQVRFVRLWVTDRKAPRVSAGERVVRVARAQVGDRYVWGASGPRAFDCSGLVRYSYKKATGKRLPHSSTALRREGRRVSNPRPGDVAWTPGHVSIYAGHGKVVEAATPRSGVTYRRMWQDDPVYLRF